MMTKIKRMLAKFRHRIERNRSKVYASAMCSTCTVSKCSLYNTGETCELKDKVAMAYEAGYRHGKRERV